MTGWKRKREEYMRKLDPEMGMVERRKEEGEEMEKIIRKMERERQKKKR